MKTFLTGNRTGKMRPAGSSYRQRGVAALHSPSSVSTQIDPGNFIYDPFFPHDLFSRNFLTKHVYGACVLQPGNRNREIFFVCLIIIIIIPAIRGEYSVNASCLVSLDRKMGSGFKKRHRCDKKVSVGNFLSFEKIAGAISSCHTVQFLMKQSRSTVSNI